MRKQINRIFKWYHQQRYRRILHFMTEPLSVQWSLFQNLIKAGAPTKWGKAHDYRFIKTPNDYAKAVPLQSYDSLKPYINRMMMGEKDVLWNGRVKWFSKSSGTTSDKSKFIPITRQNRRYCHQRAGWDTMTLFYQNRPDAQQFQHKSMLMGGSLNRYEPYPSTHFGDVSAIMIHHLPYTVRPFFAPDFKTALMDDWEEKLERMALYGSKDPNIVMIGGVPTWTVVLFRKILEITQKENMLEVWPNFQGYIHGGVSFTPYKKQFQRFFPSKKVSYQEIYNASEGFFAIQNDFQKDDLLLLLDNGIYYEFCPMDQWDSENPIAIPISEVEPYKNYALVISTNSGLWRYMTGDTILFTSLRPYKIKITGRTQQFINVFGEEVMVQNTDKALVLTCQMFNAVVSEYTVAPIFLEGNTHGRHQWFIEFEKPPADVKSFATLLDKNLQEINSDYEAKRYKNIALKQLELNVLPQGIFHHWLKSKGKLGGQHKVPRLANHRKYVEEIQSLLNKMAKKK